MLDILVERPGVQLKTMRSTGWIWFAGCAAWVFDGLVQVHYHAWVHARIALSIALLFLVAALFYRKQLR